MLKLLLVFSLTEQQVEGASLTGQGIMHGGDEPYSPFEGQAGMAYLFLDMINPLESKFPAYELLTVHLLLY